VFTICAAAASEAPARLGDFSVSKFITRVELHGATRPEDYEDLHRYMAEILFFRTIDGDNGLRYKLPSATYFSFGELSAADVRVLAKRAANKTGYSSWILVTTAGDIAWELGQAPRLPGLSQASSS
jgi:hypothetical protein